VIYFHKDFLSPVIESKFPSNNALWKGGIYVITIGGLYFLSVKFSTLFFTIPNLNISAFWPPNAIFVAFLIASPKPLWKYIVLVVFLANYLGNFLSGTGISLSIGFAVANIIEGGTIAYFMCKWNKPNIVFSSFENFFLFILIILIGSFLGAITGAGNLSLSYGFDQFWSVFRGWFSADTLGNTLLLSVILSLNDKRVLHKIITSEHLLIAVVLFVASIAVSILIYSQENTNNIIPLNYMVFPLVIWAAIQFKIKGAALVTFLIIFIAHWYTINGQGPFMVYGITIQDHIFWLQCYCAVLFITAISLALLASERYKVIKSLKVNKMIIDESSKGIIVCRLDNPECKDSFRIIAINDTAENLEPNNAHTMLGKRLNDVLDNTFDGQLLGIYQSWIKMGKGQMRHADYVPESEEDTNKCIFKCDAKYLGEYCIGVFYEDITQELQEEENRRQSTKMEALGILAGGVAHDFNNILGLITGYSDLGKEKFPQNSKELHYFDEISLAANKGANLVKKILTFSRMKPVTLKPIRLAKALNESLDMIRPSIAANIKIQRNVSEGEDYVMADETDIYQIVLNLCINASHAFEQNGGIINISLNKVLLDEAQGKSLQLNEKPYLKLDIADNGCGMTDDVVKKVFDPFFTTKKQGKGTGLGLSMIYGIIKNYQGEITLKSAVGRGTTFSIVLPITEYHQAASLNKTAISHEGYGHLLIVEDEPSLANLYKNFLTSEGYTVTTCKDGLEALNLFKMSPEKYNLVFTDQEMPNMTGKKLSTELLKIKSNIPIILTTGFSDANAEKEAMKLGIKKYFLKPIDLRQLNKTINELLLPKH